jgi:arabinofuranosyltransferase
MPQPRAIAQGAVLAVPLLIAGVAGWSNRWITDDGLIYLRVIRQITSGNGPVFNPGERVEAFTRRRVRDGVRHACR